MKQAIEWRGSAGLFPDGYERREYDGWRCVSVVTGGVVIPPTHLNLGVDWYG